MGKVQIDESRIKYGYTEKVVCGCSSVYITINHDDNNNPYELFINISKTGSCINSLTESIGRVISIALQNGAKLEDIYKTLSGVRCPNPTFFSTGGENILSCSDAIARCIKNYLDLMKGEDKK